MAAADERLEEALEEFRLCAEAEQDNRIEALDDIRFARLGDQWPEDVRAQREADSRPCLTFNVLPPVIRQVVNDGRQNKPAISVHAADSDADPDTAEVLAGLIRNIEYASRAQAAYDTALESAVTSGWGYWRVNTAYTSDDTFDQDLMIEQVPNPFSIYGDPYSTEVDSSDWNIAFVVDLIEKERFRKEFKNADEIDWGAEGYDKLGSPWREDTRIQVAQRWKREEVKRNLLLLSSGVAVLEDDFEKARARGEYLDVEVVGQPREVRSHRVTHQRLTGAEELEKPQEWPGRFIPIVPVYGEVINVEGKRVLRGLVRDAKDPQRDLNYWSTTTTELVALAPKAPFIGKKGAFKTDADKWETANTDSHAYLEYDGDTPPQRQPFSGVPAGAMQQALVASDMIKRVTGIHDASLGARSNETSGVAIKARQREGDISTFHFIDNLSRSIAHTGRILVDLIPKVYSSERVVRVLGREGLKDARPVVVGSKDDAEAAAAKRQQLMMAAQAAQQVGMQDDAARLAEEAKAVQPIYVTGLGKYDITVEAGPSFTTKREEAATQMMELARIFPQAAPIIGDLLAENLDWPGADKIAERLRTLLPPNLQGGEEGGLPPQVQQMVQQGQQVIQQLQQQLQQAQAQLAEKASEQQLKQAELQIKAEEVSVKRIEAEAKLLAEQTKARAPIFPGGVPMGAFS